jgi:hypothetical protein
MNSASAAIVLAKERVRRSGDFAELNRIVGIEAFQGFIAGRFSLSPDCVLCSILAQSDLSPILKKLEDI